jgi:RNA polymerase sigma-70 factor (ECF subfamily)
MECLTMREGSPSSAAEPDGDVMSRLGAQDVPGALRLLMQRHGRAIYRYCREALRDAILADDVHQQVFLEAYRDLPRFAGRSSVRTWLFAIARHRVLDAAKARRRARARNPVELAELGEVPDPGASPFDALDELQLRRALVASLGDLGEPARTAVLLRYQQDFTFQEMSQICGEKPGVLHARVTRALRRLRERIAVRLEGDPPRPSGLPVARALCTGTR